MKNLILIVFFVLASCASLEPTEWSGWERCGVSEEKMKLGWRICSPVKDDPELVGKGYCFKARMCRTRKDLFGRKETEFRPKQLFCAYEDQNCRAKYELFD